MKAFLRIQIFLLLVGLAWIGYALKYKPSMAVELPTALFAYGFQKFLHVPITIQRAIWGKKTITLDNLHVALPSPIAIEQITLFAPQGWRLNAPLQCIIQNGRWDQVDAIHACIQRKSNEPVPSYEGFMYAHLKNFGPIQCHLNDCFLPDEAILKPAQAMLSTLRGQCMYHLSGCTIHDCKMRNLRGRLHMQPGYWNAHVWLQNADFHAVHGERCLGMATYEFKGNALKNIHLQGDCQFGSEFATHIRGYVPSLTLEPPYLVDGYLCAKTGDSQLDAEGYFSPPTKAWACKQFSAMLSPSIAQQLQKWLPFPMPVQLHFDAPIYATGNGDSTKLRSILQTHHFTLTHTAPCQNVAFTPTMAPSFKNFTHHFQTLRASIAYDQNQIVRWDVTLEKTPSALLKTHGAYHCRNSHGNLFFSGSVAPDLTYCIEPLLPDWWREFFCPFEFKREHPFAAIEVEWSNVRDHARVWGYVTGGDFCYKHTEATHTSVAFYGSDATCTIVLPAIQAPMGSGTCWIDNDNNPLLTYGGDQWRFSGSGHFPPATWQSILQDFVGLDQDFSWIQHPSPLQAKFFGTVTLPNQDKDAVHLELQAQEVMLFDIPFSHLQATYTWTPHGHQLHRFQGNAFDQAPLHLKGVADAHNFEIEGSIQECKAEPLLHHPFFAEWAAEIPPDNRKSYHGLLDLSWIAQGQWHPTLKLHGTGSIDFKNPHLGKIHLLGPLHNLMIEPIKSLITASFNRLQADFSFTDTEIVSHNMQLSGPSSQAFIDGTLDFKNKQIDAHAAFSFLNVKRGLPLVGSLVKVLSPITQGISASITGTFKKPKWQISYNPVKFLTPTDKPASTEP